jgi:hypothetical protein
VIILGVQIDYDVVHFSTSLVQLFVLLQLNFEKSRIIELNMFGGAPNGYPFAALDNTPSVTKYLSSLIFFSNFDHSSYSKNCASTIYFVCYIF